MCRLVKLSAYEVKDSLESSSQLNKATHFSVSDENYKSVLFFESTVKTKDLSCPLCNNAVYIHDNYQTHLVDMPILYGYAMKEEMCELFQLTDRATAKKRWTEWFQAAKESDIPALVKFAELKEKRLPGLIAHAEHPISTGKLEGFNNKIKVAKRIGYGYRDDDFFFLLVKFISLPAVRFHSP